MQTSSPQNPKKVEPKSILLIGPPGGAKTTLAMQFPQVAFLDCDRNLDGPEHFVRSQFTNLSYGYIPVTYKDGAPVPVEECFDRLMEETTELRTNTEVSTVVIDGLTMVNEFIIQKILRSQKKNEMEARHWQPFKSHLINLLVAKLRSLGKTTICTCHEVVLEKPNPDKTKIMDPVLIGYRPAVQGGITDYFGGFFTDMWRCEAEPAGGCKTDYKITTARTALSDLKNSMGMPNEILVKQDQLAWPLLEPYLKGCV